MVRRMRIVIAAVIAAGVLAGAALAPAAGDRQATGSSHVTYNDDGIPVVDSGHECKAGQAGARKHHRSYSADPSDY
jgi:hypothetical protein